MDELIVEYLITLNNEQIFCNTVETFNKFIESNKDIKINFEDNELVYKGLIIKYNIDMSKNESKSIFFNLKFTLKDINMVKEFENFLRNIRIMVNSISNSDILVLWDDVSLYYSIKAYPYIHKIENLMRMLLTKFMMINVGTEWNKENVPNDIKVKRKNDGSNSTYNYLYQTDFIDLSKFLFNKYAGVTYENFIKRYNQGKNDYNIEDIIPKSNWDRYFNDSFSCDKGFLKKKWDDLYDLRNKIAHNNKFNENELNQVCNLCKEVEPVLKNAINDLGKVKVEDKDKEVVMENMVLGIEGELSKFMEEYSKLEDIVRNFSIYSAYNQDKKVMSLRNNCDKNKYNILDFIRVLFEHGFIIKNIVEDTEEIVLFRNLIVHHEINEDLKDIEIKNKIKLVKKVKSVVYDIALDDF